MLIQNSSNVLEVAEDKRLFFISDLHLNHKKLCTSYPDHFDVTRKYATIEEMNEDLIKNWNETVQPGDVVIFLGDFSLGTPHAQLAYLFTSTMQKLNGDIYCILGNHDYELRRRLERQGIEDVFVKYLIVHHKGRTYFAQHYDFDEDKENVKDALDNGILNELEEPVFVHGHTHSARQISTFFNNTLVQNCVCEDVRYAPIPANMLLGSGLDLVNKVDAQCELEEDVMHHCFKGKEETNEETTETGG